MKYPIIGQTGAAPIPPEFGAGLYQAATAWMNERLAAGKHDCSYEYAELSGGFAVGKTDSHEEIMDELLSYPLFPLMNWEVTPLCDWTHAYKKLTEYFQQVPK